MDSHFASIDGTADTDLPDGDSAEFIVGVLERLGVDLVFGVPGGAIEPLTNALARSERRGGPRLVVARHEAGAAYMADGHARASGRIGVCLATSGPGATNLLTAVACARENRVPLLAITGQPRLPTLGRGALQDGGDSHIDTVAMFGACTRYSSLVAHPEQLPAKLFAALTAARGATPGPVHLSIPVDVQRQPMAAPPWGARMAALAGRGSGGVDTAASARLLAALEAAWHPVFLIGDGCAGAIGPLMELVDATGAEFITTPDAKGLVNPRHPGYHGVFGFGGHADAEALLRRDPDLVVAFGTGFGEFASAGFAPLLLARRLVHVDACEEHLARSPMARLHVRGPIAEVCRHLLQGLGLPAIRLLQAPADTAPPPAKPAEPAPEPADSPLKPQQLMQVLGRACPPATRFVADAGNSAAWAVHALAPACRRLASAGPLVERRRDRDSWLRVTMDFAPMGWAIGAAVGIAGAQPGQPVVCVTGDGSWLMNGAEITVAAELRLPVVYVVLNDGALGMVRHGQRLAGAESTGWRLPAVDFALLAQALGVPAHRVDSARALAALDWAAICARPGPTLIDARIDADEVPPMQMRLRALGSA